MSDNVVRPVKPNFPWDSNLVLKFFKIVHQYRPYAQAHTKSPKVWKTIVKHFVGHIDWKKYPSYHSAQFESDTTRFKKFYHNKMADFRADSRLAAKTGQQIQNPPSYYSVAQLITTEKEILDANGTLDIDNEITESQQAEVSDNNGTVSDLSLSEAQKKNRKKRRRDTDDAEDIEQAKIWIARIQTYLEANKKPDELEVRNMMFHWIEKNKLTLDDLLQQAGVQKTTDLPILKKITLEVMVAVLCSKGSNYSDEIFRQEMSKVGCKDALAINKLLMRLQQWRLSVVK